MFRFLLTSALTLSVVAAQCQSNTNPNCAIGALPQDGSTVYYAPTDSGNIEIFAQAIGACDSGSSADVSFYSTYQDSSAGNFISDCGCLPLDGNPYVLDCGVPKGSIPEGGYHFDIQVGSAGDALDRFNIVHHQDASTAAAPTSTVTTSTYESTTITTTLTSVDTVTSPQITVTSPAGTTVTAVTITPSPVTSTTTSIQTKKQREEIILVTQKTITSTAPCAAPSLKPCPITPKKKATNNRPHLHPRQQNGYTVTGDGPLTTTVTPQGVVVTQTVDGGTITSTNSAYTTLTTTIAAVPPTTTVYAGTATNIQTTTLSASTSVVTAHSTTTTTVKQTITLEWLHVAHVTPTCKPKKPLHH
ncbi:MAG: hypothetical protein M1821_009250 [Bathelium mastoideum]|nr:MAG: hypothetical protein M1821_009250 [Bathelium mastoideum]